MNRTGTPSARTRKGTPYRGNQMGGHYQQFEKYIEIENPTEENQRYSHSTMLPCKRSLSPTLEERKEIEETERFLRENADKFDVNIYEQEGIPSSRGTRQVHQPGLTTNSNMHTYNRGYQKPQIPDARNPRKKWYSYAYVEKAVMEGKVRVNLDRLTQEQRLMVQKSREEAERKLMESYRHQRF